MTDADLERLKNLADAASAGPWRADPEPCGFRMADCTWDVGDEQAAANAEFIAACREGVPALLAHVAELRAALVEVVTTCVGCAGKGERSVWRPIAGSSRREQTVPEPCPRCTAWRKLLGGGTKEKTDG